MTTIPPVGPSVALQATPAAAPVMGPAAPSLPQDGFAYGSPAADPMQSFWRQARELSQDLAARADLGTPQALVTEKTAGWQTHLFGAQGCGCYVKVPVEGESILVLPVRNCSGGNFGKPVVVDPQRGIVATPDVRPGDNPMCLRAERSPDGERLYVRTGSSGTMRVYDRAFSSEQEIDIAKITPDFGIIRDFHSGRQVDLVFAVPKNFDSDKGCLVGLDPKSHQPVFTKEVDTRLSWDLYEDPRGNFYVSTETRGQASGDSHALQIISPTGQDLGTLPMNGSVKSVAFRDDGLMVCCAGHPRSRVSAMVETAPGQFSEKWAIENKNYRQFQFTPDGRFVYAMDPCDGFSRCHVVVKIDADTGQEVWRREAYGEHFSDMRVVGDDLFVLSSGNRGAERDVVHMRRFDASNALTWEDTQKLGEMDEYPEGMRGSITAQGNFVFGGSGNGNLFFLHPRQPGETEDTIRDAISHSSDVLTKATERLEESLQEAQETAATQVPGVEVHDEFILVAGVRIQKRTD